jgi:hypothetical protein
MCQVQGQNGRFGIYLAPWDVYPGGLWLDGFKDPDEAMAAAEYHQPETPERYGRSEAKRARPRDRPGTPAMG